MIPSGRDDREDLEELFARLQQEHTVAWLAAREGRLLSPVHCSPVNSTPSHYSPSRFGRSRPTPLTNHRRRPQKYFSPIHRGTTSSASSSPSDSSQVDQTESPGRLREARRTGSACGDSQLHGADNHLSSTHGDEWVDVGGDYDQWDGTGGDYEQWEDAGDDHAHSENPARDSLVDPFEAPHNASLSQPYRLSLNPGGTSRATLVLVSNTPTPTVRKIGFRCCVD